MERFKRPRSITKSESSSTKRKLDKNLNRLRGFTLLETTEEIKENLDSTGFSLHRNLCNDNESVAAALERCYLDSLDDVGYKWTALKDGGNPGKISDSMKCFEHEEGDI